MRSFIHMALIMALLVGCGQKEETAEKVPPAKNTGNADKTIPKPVPDGPFKETYPDGHTKMEGEILNGTRNGTWVAYYPDGTKQSEAYYEDGKINGKTATYYPSGRVRYLGYYRWDKPSGTWEFYNEDGTLASTKEYK